MVPKGTQSVTLKKADFRETLLQGNMTQIDSQEQPREPQELPKGAQEWHKSS